MLEVFYNTDISARNSFHVRQYAAALAEFDSPDDLRRLFDEHRPQRWMVLSGGNNILFTQDFDGMLIVPRDTRITVVGDDPQATYVHAGAGVEWDDLVEWAVAHGLWGLENLSLIPGKAGAAPVQNIGAYGAEACNTIVEVEMFCPETMNMLTLAAEHCAFGYRESIFKHSLRGRVIITGVKFRLAKAPQPNIAYGDLQREVEARGGATLRNIRDAVCAIRRSKLPDTTVLGNAGSFFKNPVVERETVEKLREKYPDMPVYPAADPEYLKLAAGWLIDRAGMKGFTEGCVGVHDRQALVLVNRGGATGGEVLALARKVQQRVFEKFGIEIETEVNIV